MTVCFAPIKLLEIAAQKVLFSFPFHLDRRECQLITIKRNIFFPLLKTRSLALLEIQQSSKDYFGPFGITGHISTCIFNA